MKLPRWLVILVVVLVVLQGASCALPALDIDLDISPRRLGELLDGVTPDPAPIDLADVVACGSIPGSGIVQFSTPCPLAIEAAQGSVRRLTIEETGAHQIEIRMTAPATPRLEVSGSDHLDIAPDERIEARLICASIPPCLVRFVGRES